MGESAMLAHLDGQLCDRQERRRLSTLQKERSRRFVDGWRKGEHILRPDRLFVRKEPGLSTKRFTQALVRRRFQLCEGVEYLATKAVQISASKGDFDLASRRP